MRVARRWRGLAGLLLSLCCALLLVGAGSRPAAAASDSPPILTLSTATITTRVDGKEQPQQAVELPYHWDKYNPGKPGEARFTLRFDLPQPLPAEPMALLLSKVGNRFEVGLNGTLLDRAGDLSAANSDDYSQLPHYVNVPSNLLRPHNELVIRIQADIGRRGGLAAVVVGPLPPVHDSYTRQYLLRGASSAMVSVFSFIAGAIALSLWASQVDRSRPPGQQRDPLYLYAGIAELVWAVGLCYVLVDQPPIPWPWWGMGSTLFLASWGVSMVMFCAEVAGWRHHPALRGLRAWMGVLLALCPVMAYLALGRGLPSALTAWYAALGLTCITFAGAFCWRVLRQGRWAERMVAAALLLNFFMGMRDLYVFRIEPQYGQVTLLRYSSMLFGLALLYIVITRFHAADARARELLGTLSTRLAERERELQASYVQMERLARAQERASERGRILGDIHDGVGAHLSTAIRQVESGQAQPSQLLATLRDSLDQLKLTVDAMRVAPGDVNGLLADLRYRLEPRLRSAELALEWQVGLLPRLESLDPQGMRHLQFIVFEAFSNVLQHARARRMGVSAQALPEAVSLHIWDDGVGFDVQAPLRHGLRQMQERARAIGADLAWSSAQGRTVLAITLRG